MHMHVVYKVLLGIFVGRNRSEQSIDHVVGHDLEERSPHFAVLMIEG